MRRPRLSKRSVQRVLALPDDVTTEIFRLACAGMSGPALREMLAAPLTSRAAAQRAAERIKDGLPALRHELKRVHGFRADGRRRCFKLRVEWNTSDDGYMYFDMYSSVYEGPVVIMSIARISPLLTYGMVSSMFAQAGAHCRDLYTTRIAGIAALYRYFHPM